MHLRKYNIIGENNPNWVIAEPMLFEIWAEGILKTASKELQFVNILALAVEISMFLGSMALRIAVVALIIFLGYSLFPQTLSLSFDLVFSGAEITRIQYNHLNSNILWMYELLGYVILIKSVMFLLGKTFTEFVINSCSYLIMMLTNMIPLRFIARGMQKERYFAQILAKTTFMGTYIVQTIAATSPEVQNQWDKIINLYENSNDPSAREELIRLSESHAKKPL